MLLVKFTLKKVFFKKKKKKTFDDDLYNQVDNEVPTTLPFFLHFPKI